jgi:hypothetical protein
MSENDDFDMWDDVGDIYHEIDHILKKMMLLTGKTAYFKRVFCEIGRLEEQVKLLVAFYENNLNRGE